MAARQQIRPSPAVAAGPQETSSAVASTGGAAPRRRAGPADRQGAGGGGLDVWGLASARQAAGESAVTDDVANPAPSLAEVEGGAEISQGQTGPAVAWVQGTLTRLGFPVAQSGTLGSMTVGLLQEFQRVNKVQATGVIGPTTLARLRAAVEASVSLAELQKLAPGVDRAQLVSYLPHLNAAMLQHGITSDARKAAFLAQLGHESDGFNTLEEYASGADYEWRSDLGNVFAGDGRRFKGRGPIQITGRYNYGEYGRKLGVDLIEDPGLAATPEVGFQIAGQYWADHGLNELADQGRFDSITQRINGGQNGATDRHRRWGQARQVLAEGRGRPKVPTAPLPRTPRGPSAVSPAAPPATSPAPAPARQPTVAPETAELAAIVARIAGDDATGARSDAARFAADRRRALGVADDALTRAAGSVWTAADRMVAAVAALRSGDASGAQDAAHESAEALRAARDSGALDAAAVDAAIGRAGRLWTQAADQQRSQVEATGQAHRGHAVWTTGRSRGQGAVTSRELDRDGQWTRDQFLAHHSDRSGSWAAGNIRDGKNQDVQAWDFTFEKQNQSGQALAGTAQGLELISPWDARVHDVQHTYAGSGGYGRFIALEDVETGLRFEVHHLDTVADVRKGQLVDGGSVIGTQGGSGATRHSYATHVDIVGTIEAVEQFVRANQSGRFRSRKRRGGA